MLIAGIGTFTTYHHSIFEFLFTSQWNPADDFTGGGHVGAAIYIVGSLVTCGLALFDRSSVSSCAAIFITEISPEIWHRFLPARDGNLCWYSVGCLRLVGMTVLVPFIKNLFNLNIGYGVLPSGIVLAIMIFPSITSVAADAIRGVPMSFREASYGLGSTRWQTIYKIVLPSAKSGILTGVILGLARAFGEALAVAMVIGKMRAFPENIFSPTMSMTTVIASDMGGAAEGGEYNTALWTIALLLFLISLLFIFLVHLASAKGEKNKK